MHQIMNRIGLDKSKTARLANKLKLRFYLFWDYIGILYGWFSGVFSLNSDGFRYVCTIENLCKLFCLI